MTRTQIKHLLYKEWLKTRWFALGDYPLDLRLHRRSLIVPQSGRRILLLDTALGQHFPDGPTQISAAGRGSAHRIVAIHARNHQQTHTPHPTPSHRRDGCRLYDDIVRRRSLLLRAVAGGSHHDDNDGGMFSRRNNHTSMADAVSLVAGRNDKLFLRSHDCI